MRFAPNHDDRMRALRAKLETPTAEAEVSGVPVQLTRELGDAAIERSAAKVAVRLPTFTVARRAHRVAQAHGGMKAFLAHARTVQNLPHFASLPARATTRRRE